MISKREKIIDWFNSLLFFILLFFILLFFILLLGLISSCSQSTDPTDTKNENTNIETDFPIAAPKNGGVYVIAHSGAHNGIPENSIPAYQKAIDLGCDFIEIDTRLTNDGQIVSIHNSTIDAYVDGASGKVNKYSLEQLKSFDIGERFGDEYKNTHIPTFEEILQLCKGKINIYLDLKEPIIPELVLLIQKYEMEENIVWYIPASEKDLIYKVKFYSAKCIPMPDPGPKENISRIVREVNPLVLATDMEQKKNRSK